jgi:class 3 adenylate cyclase
LALVSNRARHWPDPSDRAHRRTHTLLGDTVTITLRIQEMTAELAQPILLGECVARQLDDLKPESQGSYLLAGLRTPHTLFAPGHRRACAAPDAARTAAP